MPNGRVDFFDGIRGWASIIVLFSHICNTFPSLGVIRNTPARIFVDGEFSVYIFFVLSGIVLSIRYFKENEICHVSQLIIKRIPRLGIPVFISCLFIIFLMKYDFMFNSQAALVQNGNGWLSRFYKFEESLSYAFKFSFLNMFFQYNESKSYNPVLWTMHGELFGTFMIAISILSFHFTTKKLSSLFVILYLASKINSIYFSFAIGMLISYIYIYIYDIIHQKVFKSILLLVFILSYYFLDHKGNFLAIDAALFILTVISIKRINLFFSNKISSFIGKISFPLYIVHMPIICSFTSYFIVYFEDKYIEKIFLLSFSTIVLSIIFAYMFYPVERFAIFSSARIAKILMR